MGTTTIKFSDFRERLEKGVLAALDSTAESVLNAPNAYGWRDGDLKPLVAAIAAQAATLAARINTGVEPNSANVTIDMTA